MFKMQTSPSIWQRTCLLRIRLKRWNERMKFFIHFRIPKISGFFAKFCKFYEILTTISIFWDILWNSGKNPWRFSRKMANFRKFGSQNQKKWQKIVVTFLLKFWDLSGAKECKSCRSRKSLKNEPLVAIVAVHTAENEPLKVLRVICSLFQAYP